MDAALAMQYAANVICVPCLLSLEMLLWTVTSGNTHWHTHVRIPCSMNRNLTDKINIQLTRLWLSQVLATMMSDLYSSVGCQPCWRRNEWSGWLSQGKGIPSEDTRRGTGIRITSSRSHYRLPQWSVLSMCATESGLESARHHEGTAHVGDRNKERGWIGGMIRSQSRRLSSIHNANCAIKIKSAIMNQITVCE